MASWTSLDHISKIQNMTETENQKKCFSSFSNQELSEPETAMEMKVSDNEKKTVFVGLKTKKYTDRQNRTLQNRTNLQWKVAFKSLRVFRELALSKKTNQRQQKCSKTLTRKPCSNRGPSQQPSHESCESAPPAGATSQGSCTDMSSKLSFGSEAVLLAGVSSAECIGLALAEAGGFFPNPNIVLV
nr:hypothetical protein Iba_chr08cCG11720 [Ipomoea batatas]